MLIKMVLKKQFDKNLLSDPNRYVEVKGIYKLRLIKK